MKKKTMRTILFFALLLALAVLYACATEKSIAKSHPVEVSSPAICSECHKDGRAALDHSPDFIDRHKFYGPRSETCNSCHTEAYCFDCHAHREEMKPSDKYKDSPERSLPHRGDYLTQHKIDGRINPAACFRCHGRNNNGRCVTCHR